MQPSSYIEAYNLLISEHKEKYEYFIRLLLTLSVGFITLVVGLKSGGVTSSIKIGIIFHALSILFGLWLQYILIIRPLNDIDKLNVIYETDENAHNGIGAVLKRSPGKWQKYLFLLQVSAFIFAFSSVVIGIVL